MTDIKVRRSPKCTTGHSGPKCGLLVYMHGITMTVGTSVGGLELEQEKYFRLEQVYI